MACLADEPTLFNQVLARLEGTYGPHTKHPFWPLLEKEGVKPFLVRSNTSKPAEAVKDKEAGVDKGVKKEDVIVVGAEEPPPAKKAKASPEKEAIAEASKAAVADSGGRAAEAAQPMQQVDEEEDELLADAF